MLSEQLARHPSVRLRGQLNVVKRAFLASDVLLVPTPINLGTRTRVIEGFSYGCCIVAHETNALGISQMIDRENVERAPNTEEHLVRAAARRADAPSTGGGLRGKPDRLPARGAS